MYGENEVVKLYQKMGEEFERCMPDAEKFVEGNNSAVQTHPTCLLYTSPSPRDGLLSRMPSSA